MACFPMPVTALFCLALLTGVAGATTATTAAAAELAPVPAPAAAAALAERLEGDAPQQCWETLMQIKSCTGEIILFFLNGEAYLGPACCRAIRAIEQSCWSADAVLTVIGFTPQEGDLLKGYCDAGDDDGNSGGQGQQQQQHGAAPPLQRAADDGGAAGKFAVGAVAGRKQGPVHRG